MTSDVNLEPTFDTPRVLFDSQKGRFEIRGNSMPEDPVRFYQPLVSSIHKYIKDPRPRTTLIIDLEYFNSSSLKQLVFIFSLLENIAQQKKKVRVEWHYDSDDELMEVKGLEIQSIVDLEFELVPKPVRI